MNAWDGMNGGHQATATDPGPMVDVWAKIGLHLETQTALMREQQRQRDEIANCIWSMTAPVIPLISLPVSGKAAADCAPKTGFVWVVQRIVVGPLGAATDLLTVYRGHTTADAVPQNALNSFNAGANNVAGSFVNWHPGGKALVLKAGETLVFAGTITGTAPAASAEVIQVTETKLPLFLL